MVNRIASFALAAAALAVAGAPMPALARGGFGGGFHGGGFGGGFHGGDFGGFHGASVGHFGDTSFARGPNGFAAANDGHVATYDRNTGVGRTGDFNDNNLNRNNFNNNDFSHNTYNNVNVDNGWNGDDWGYHPYGYAAAAAVGATAAVATAAAIGSTVYALPPACAAYGMGYYYCGGVYYQPQYEGSNIVYTVVAQP